MEQHLEEFERALLRRNLRPNSIRAYLRAARRFLSEADAPLSELTRQHITDYLDCLIAEGAAAQTRNQIMAALRLFMSEGAGALEASAGVRRAITPPRPAGGGSLSAAGDRSSATTGEGDDEGSPRALGGDGLDDAEGGDSDGQSAEDSGAAREGEDEGAPADMRQESPADSRTNFRY